LFIKTLIPLTLCLFLSLYCSSVQCAVSQQTISENTDNANIVQLIKLALEYDWWSAKNDDQLELSRFYEDPALDRITMSIKEYRKISTDWYNLTFLENCHIVYNNGNIAIAIASVKDTDITTNDTQIVEGVFILHNTSDGWRIREMNYYWHAANSPEVTTL